MNELTIKTFADAISTGTVVVDVWMDNCSYCVEYEPIFQSVADITPTATFVKFKLNIADLTTEWKSTYFKVKAGEQMKAPATLVFKDGKMVNRKFGIMTQEELEQFLQLRSLEDLFAEKWELISSMNVAAKQIHELNMKAPETLTYEDKVAGGKAATAMDTSQLRIHSVINPQIDSLQQAGALVVL